MTFDTQRRSFDKEHIYVVEIDIPRCVNVHGVNDGSIGCFATETGNDKCYNTRTTCNDIENYNELIDTGAITINVNATNGTFTRTSGSYLTDGFEVGQIITTSGFTNDGNNYDFEISAVTATVITVTSNYNLTTESGGGDEQITTPNLYTYRFCSARSPHPQNLVNVAPCVTSVNIAPATVDAKGGIGARTSATVSMNDFPSSDRYDIDPYLSDRTYDPLEQGLHFTKWRARNANYENNDARIYSGYIVDNAYDADNFDVRYYVVAGMTATNGQASFKFKDPLQNLSNKESLAPAPSTGTIGDAGGINATVTTINLQPSGVGNSEYPSTTGGSFWIKVESEVMEVTNRSGDVLTVVRGDNNDFNTASAAHSQDDTVQLCLEYDGTSTLDEVQADLLINYGNVPARYIPRSQWFAEVDTYMTSNPNRLITDPTKVKTLVTELCDQWPHKLYWNDRLRQITLDAIWEPPTTADPISDTDDILELSVSDKNEMQISTVFVFYAQVDPTKKTDEKDNYAVTYVRSNTDAIARYNSNNTKVVYAPWITSGNGANARRLAQLHGRRFGITPRQVSFGLEDKNANIWLGENHFINHRDIVDQNGANVDTLFEITSASEGDVYQYQALEYNYDELISGVDDDLSIDVVDLSVSDQDVNLYTEYVAVYGTPGAAVDVKFIVYSGVVIGASSIANDAIDTGSSWPSGSTLQLQVNSGGIIAGHGGDGLGPGNGGDAINLTYDLELINNGIIGGGGGRGESRNFAGQTAHSGGGAGNDPGNANTSNGATAGSTTLGGSGGFVSSGPDAAIGGFGGALGNTGGASSGAGTGNSDQGSPGRAIHLNGNTLTQTVAGDIRGAIS